MSADLLETVSAIFAIFAAVLWIASTFVKTPRDFTVQVISAHLLEEEGAVGTSVISEGYGTSKELEVLGEALIRQSRLNAAGAVCAAISAICHAAVFVAGHL